MIPQFILTTILLLLAWNSFRDKDRSPAHFKTFQITAGFVALVIALLIWGGYYDQIKLIL